MENLTKPVKFGIAVVLGLVPAWTLPFNCSKTNTG